MSFRCIGGRRDGRAGRLRRNERIGLLVVVVQIVGVAVAAVQVVVLVLVFDLDPRVRGAEHQEREEHAGHGRGSQHQREALEHVLAQAVHDLQVVLVQLRAVAERFDLSEMLQSGAFRGSVWWRMSGWS